MKSVIKRSAKVKLVLAVGFLMGFAGYAVDKQSPKLPSTLTATAVENKGPEHPKFTKKFNSLVSRAYFKLIVEAERADIRLGKEYKRLYAKNEDKMDDLVIQEEFTLVYQRFLAHRRMLSGLKSWKIFSDNRTGDLEYFKKEYRETIYNMYKKKSSEDEMVAFLMYRLADLYHLPS